MNAELGVYLDDLPEFDARLMPLLQAILIMEASGISRDEIDQGMERAYARLLHTGALTRVNREFRAALDEARRRISQNGSEGTCQLADLTQDVMH
uniref:Uncharacterized protein n=1 Tax=Bosea sp. NBC_00436 TaxID=2969620 RepID=A0A9E7ZX54_9HYPH